MDARAVADPRWSAVTDGPLIDLRPRALEVLDAWVAGTVTEARRRDAEFVTRVSHELRTPVTIVAGYASTLLEHGDGFGEDERRHMLERIDVAAARLSALIDELVLVAGARSGSLGPFLERVRLRDILDQVRKEAVDPDLVSVDCADHVAVVTDPGLVQRALGFLVDNAVKHGGGAELHGRHGVIEVVDHGPGIGSTTAGVGLAMARTLVEVLGGELSLTDVPGGGTRAEVRLRT
jgi:two-component system sensor histidine kinase KdpD